MYAIFSSTNWKLLAYSLFEIQRNYNAYHNSNCKRNCYQKCSRDWSTITSIFDAPHHVAIVICNNSTHHIRQKNSQNQKQIRYSFHKNPPYLFDVLLRSKTAPAIIATRQISRKIPFPSIVIMEDVPICSDADGIKTDTIPQAINKTTPMIQVAIPRMRFSRLFVASV